MDGEPYINIPDRVLGIVDREGEPRDIAAPCLTHGGFVNKLCNATFDIWQRGPAGFDDFDFDRNRWLSRLADCWIGFYPQWGTIVASRANAWGPASTFFAVRIVNEPTAGRPSIGQRIESLIATTLAGHRCTFQCLIYNNTGEPLLPHLNIEQWATADNPNSWSQYDTWPMQIVPAGEWRRVAYTFQAPEQFVNGGYIEVQFGNTINNSIADRHILFCEPDLRETPSWPVGLCDDPPPPELRPLPIELMFCQRYFEKSYNLNVAPGTNTGTGLHLIHATGLVVQGNFMTQRVDYKVLKRVSATVNTFTPDGQSGLVLDATADALFASGIWNPSQIGVGIIGSAVSPAFSSVNFQFHWTASAEL